ncbi:MAG: FAD-dependent oxidoreductase [Desulfobacterales bacterium]
MNKKENLQVLFEPLEMKNLTLKNRFFMAPMGTGYGMDRLQDYLVARAKGDVGLITTAEISVHRSGRAGIAHEPRLEIDDDIKTLAPLVKAVQKAGSKVVGQLNHVGRYAFSRILGHQSVAPSAVVSKYTGEIPRELTTDEVDELVEAFATAACRAQKAGFDGVEFCGCSGYLISQFLSPLTNRREDKYGGNIQKRSRFITDILKETRCLTGPDFNICVKFDAEDGMKGGKTLDDSKTIAPMLIKAGADRLHIWAGWHESSRPMLPMFVSRGAFSYLAREIKKTVDVPVAAVGRINDPYLAAEIIERGDADLIGLGRPLLCDPEFVLKAKTGRSESIRKCIACCHCFDRMMIEFRGTEKKGVVCALNAELGREGENLIKNASKTKKVVVVGAGPAGMEAARVAALRGHDVSVYEKSVSLGGMVNIACIPPHKNELKNIVPYYESVLKQLGVKIYLKKEMTVDRIRPLSPDTVILAQGSSQLIPDIPGVDKKHVVTAIDILTGKTSAHGKVIVVGGGLVGMETAEFLADSGNIVTVVEMMNSVLEDAGITSRWGNLSRMKNKMKIMTLSRVFAIGDDAVTILDKEKNKISLDADTVVLAAGMKENKIPKEYSDSGWEIYIIGSCKSTGLIAQAISEGFEIGCLV